MPSVRKQKGLLECRAEFRGDKHTPQAQWRYRGVGRDMGQVGLKFGGRAWAVSQAGTREVVVTKEEKHRP